MFMQHFSQLFHIKCRKIKKTKYLTQRRQKTTKLRMQNIVFFIYLCFYCISSLLSVDRLVIYKQTEIFQRLTAIRDLIKCSR